MPNLPTLTARCEVCRAPESECRCSGPCSLEALCRACTVRRLLEADARGDGSLVNALCAYGRSQFGVGLYW